MLLFEINPRVMVGVNVEDLHAEEVTENVINLSST